MAAVGTRLSAVTRSLASRATVTRTGCDAETVFMGHTKRQFENLIESCAGDNGFAGDAIAWAIQSGMIHTTGDHDKDTITICSAYDVIIESYRAAHGDLDSLHRLSTPADIVGQSRENFTMPAVDGSVRTEGQRVEGCGPRPEPADVESPRREAVHQG